MDVNIDPSWRKELQDEFDKPYFKKLVGFVKGEYGRYSCYPPVKKVFAAFEYCPFDQVKLVILGQDPYHGKGQAHGLCFSVNESVAIPPSLINIFREIETDLGKPFPKDGNLKRWAEQGVLLLNATLTVRAGQAGSHQNKGWGTFTDAVVEKISNERENIVFFLWGNPAKRKGEKIDKGKHLVLSSGHPSPLSANRGLWFGNKHFGKANAYLREKGKKEIDW